MSFRPLILALLIAAHGTWAESVDNYRLLDGGSSEPQLAEYRIAEDARIATDAPIDLLVATWPQFLSSKEAFERLRDLATANIRSAYTEQVKQQRYEKVGAAKKAAVEALDPDSALAVAEVTTERVRFCPFCGASLPLAPTPTPSRPRRRWTRPCNSCGGAPARPAGHPRRLRGPMRRTTEG